MATLNAPITAPRGTTLQCKGWRQEAALRMLMNNLDPEVAEAPDRLVVYGGTGKAARDWPSFHAIVRELQSLENDETLLVQSGKPVGVFRTHDDAPRVLIANSNLVGHWSDWEHFRELERLGLIMYGQMTAGSWIYIGSQGILQGTYETFAAAARKHFGGSLAGKFVMSGGLGGMGGAQPLAATMNRAVFLGIEADPARIRRRLESGYCDRMASSLDEALAWVARSLANEDGAFHRACRKLRRGPARNRPPRRRPRFADRSNQRARSAERLHPRRLGRRRRRPSARFRSRRIPQAIARFHRRPRPRHARSEARRRHRVRLRQ